MKEFITASNFAENIVSNREEENSHDCPSTILDNISRFVMLPKDMGDKVARLTENKGYRKCSMCSKNCAYRGTEHIIDGERIYFNHCQTNNTYFFTRG